MHPLQENIQRVNEKLQLLLKKHRNLQRDNEKLKKELLDIKTLHTARAEQLEMLEQKVAVLKTATSNMGEEDKKELEKRINFYIGEIDRCIAMLNE